MKKIKKIEYQCRFCEATYSSKKEALTCEARKITQDKGVEIGDEVLITGGQGSGCKGKITNKWVVSKEWGHYFWERYWHTIAISVNVIDGWGSRTLTFDQYKTISVKKTKLLKTIMNQINKRLIKKINIF